MSVSQMKISSIKFYYSQLACLNLAISLTKLQKLLLSALTNISVVLFHDPEKSFCDNGSEFFAYNFQDSLIALTLKGSPP